jgi:hypothetical protein
MDILTTLRDQGKKLYPEDLDFFEVELVAGEYDEVYVLNCRKEIESIRMEQAKKDKREKPPEVAGNPKSSVWIDLDKLTPQGVASPADIMSDTERIMHGIRQIRKSQESLKEGFRDYV